MLEIFYVNEAALLLLDENNYTSNSIWFYYLLNGYLKLWFCFSKGITNMSQVTVLTVSEDNLQLTPQHFHTLASAFPHCKQLTNYKGNWHMRACSKWYFARPRISVSDRGISSTLNRCWNFQWIFLVFLMVETFS